MVPKVVQGKQFNSIILCINVKTRTCAKLQPRPELSSKFLLSADYAVTRSLTIFLYFCLLWSSTVSHCLKYCWYSFTFGSFISEFSRQLIGNRSEAIDYCHYESTETTFTYHYIYISLAVDNIMITTAHISPVKLRSLLGTTILPVLQVLLCLYISSKKITLTVKRWSFVNYPMPAQRNPPHSKRHQISRSFYSIQWRSIIKVCNRSFYLFIVVCW